MGNQPENADKPSAPPTAGKKPPKSNGQAPTLRDVFPDARTLFRPIHDPATILKDCVFVLDTSCLLSPFDVGQETMESFRTILESLANADRVFVPFQAAREYVNRRTAKIEETFSKLRQAQSKDIRAANIDYRMLQSSEAVVKLREAVKKQNEASKEYAEKIGKLIEEVRAWTWNDPVTKMYSEIFKDRHYIDHETNESEIRAEFILRCDALQPPCDSDRDKPEGFGDLAIWKTILAYGKAKPCNITFVTNEKKREWWSKSKDELLAVRFELINEYNRETGKYFTIVDFAGFLSSNAATDSVVEDAKEAITADVESESNSTLARQQSLFSASETDTDVFHVLVQSHNLATDCLSFVRGGTGRNPQNLDSRIAHILASLNKSLRLYMGELDLFRTLSTLAEAFADIRIGLTNLYEGKPEERRERSIAWIAKLCKIIISTCDRLLSKS